MRILGIKAQLLLLEGGIKEEIKVSEKDGIELNGLNYTLAFEKSRKMIDMFQRYASFVQGLNKIYDS